MLFDMNINKKTKELLILDVFFVISSFHDIFV